MWRYIFEHDLPYNPLHDRGYESIGCAPCTHRAPAARAAGRAPTRPSAACTSSLSDAWTRWSSSSGSASGILVGLTGIGGGSLMTPLLILIFIGTSRWSPSAPTSPTARSRRPSAAGATAQGTVDMGVSSGWRRLVPGASPASSLDRSTCYGDAFDDVLLSSSPPRCDDRVITLGRALFMPQRRARAPHGRRSTAPQGRRGALGAVARLHPRRDLASAPARSSASALILVFRLTPHRVVGTDVFHAAILLWAAGIAHCRRQRRLRADGDDPDRLAARASGSATHLVTPRARRGAAAGARLRAARLGARRRSRRPASTCRVA